MYNNQLIYPNIKLINTKKIALVVFSFLLVFISPLPAVAEEGRVSLFLTPAKETYGTGEVFEIQLKVSTSGAPINAARAEIVFPRELLEVVSVSKEDSIFKLWPEKPNFSNKKGEISFQGGLPSPGFTGIGSILSIRFKTKKTGEAEISFTDSAVLAADGKGTDILDQTEKGYFNIIKVGPKIYSPTHPKEEFWYSKSNPKFLWEITSDIVGLSQQFNQTASSLPGAVSEGIFGERSFENVEDGIWYFHLRAQNEDGWTRPSHFKVQIDTTPPSPFDVAVDNQGDSTNPRPLLYFEAEDNFAGVSHYEIEIDEEDKFSIPIAGTNPFQLPLQMPGFHKILVRAIDKAGNFRDAAASLNIESIPVPEISVYPRTYTAGEEVLYIEGKAAPDLTAIIFFEKDKKVIETWEAQSDRKGSWSFSTESLFKSGNYTISARSRDNRGAVSHSSPSYPVEVILAGISLGSLLLTYQNIALILTGLIILAVGVAVYFVVFKKRRLKKETKEAVKSLKTTFLQLKKEIDKRVEYLDKKPGLNPEEKKLRDELLGVLEKSETAAIKEIQDIEKELKY